MENLNIEKLDKLRARLLLWTTIGFGAWYGMNILIDLTPSVPIKVGATFLSLVASVIWFVTLIKMLRLGKAIQLNGYLKNALNDELFLHNRTKAFEVGFWSLMIVIAIFTALCTYISLPSLLVCKITLYVGVLSFLIAALVYNRN